MIYYGIVDRIEDKHKSGIYGRRPFSKIETTNFDLLNYSTYVGIAVNWILIPRYMPIGLAINLILKLLKSSPIKLMYEIEDNVKSIIIKNELLQENYGFRKSESILHGLFDEFNKKEKVFKSLMKSKGGSDLMIIERENIDKKHFGGEEGKFNYGIHIPHPKLDDTLIPLKNAEHLVKSLILEEVIQAFQCLGAKMIKILDITDIDVNAGVQKDKVEVNMEGEYKKLIIREKEFGHSKFQFEEVLKNKVFIHDLPNIKTVIEGRITGNQTKEVFTEIVNLSFGLDINVLQLFSGNIGFNYTRNWHFEVEFFDKNENVTI